VIVPILYIASLPDIVPEFERVEIVDEFVIAGPELSKFCIVPELLIEAVEAALYIVDLFVPLALFFIVPVFVRVILPILGL
jgi:hypothetical protein